MFCSFPSAANIVQSNDNEITSKYSCDQMVSVHYYQYTQFHLECLFHNDMSQPKLSSFTDFLFNEGIFHAFFINKYYIAVVLNYDLYVMSGNVMVRGKNPSKNFFWYLRKNSKQDSGLIAVIAVSIWNINPPTGLSCFSS